MNRAWPSIGSLLSRMFLGCKRLLTHRGLRNENILLFWYVFKKAQFYTQEENIANRVWLEPECCLVIVAIKSHKKINTQLWWLSIGMSDHYINFLTLVFLATDGILSMPVKQRLITRSFKRKRWRNKSNEILGPVAIPAVACHPFIYQSLQGRGGLKGYCVAALLYASPPQTIGPRHDHHHQTSTSRKI